MSECRSVQQCPRCGRYWQWSFRAQLMLDPLLDAEIIAQKTVQTECYRCRQRRRMSQYKRECVDCRHCQDGFCEIYQLEIIVGRIDIADQCLKYAKKEGGA